MFDLLPFDILLLKRLSKIPLQAALCLLALY